MSNGGAGPITPFFTIWIEPRATIRRIVDSDPRRYAIPLAAIGPAMNALASQWSRALNNNANLSVLWPLWVAVLVAFEAVLGVILLFVFGAVFKWSGGLLGGVASRVEVRGALAWSQIPGIVAVTILLIAVLSGVPIPQPTPGALHIDPAFYKVMLVEAVLAIWGFVVSLKCIAEVHRFSAWRALGAILIPALIAMVAVGVLVFLVVRLAHR